MLEDAMKNDNGKAKVHDGMKKSMSQASQKFLKKKEKYDPRKAL